MDAMDLHTIRHRLKLLRKTSTTEQYENRDSVTCPACSEPFEGLLATSERTHSFGPLGGAGFCFVRESDRMLMFTHE